MQKLIKVAACAIIKPNSRLILAGQRKADRLMGNYWEFPGGKIKPGETAKQAAQREVKEELGIDVILGDKVIDQVKFHYDYGTIELTVFYGKTQEENFNLVAHSHLKWVNQAELNKLNWLPANYQLVDKIQQCDLSQVKFFKE